MSKKKKETEIYTEAQLDAVEAHIERYFGKFDNVLHEICSPDIHVDICVIQPTEERNRLTLVTMGMGAHRMNVPAELADKKLERAELMLCLPAYWDISSTDEKDYWPIRLLKRLARLPISSDTWLGWGHTVENDGAFADNTEMNASLLLNPGAYEPEADVCVLPDGDEVNFYQVLPLYEDEIDYKLEKGIDELLEKMTGRMSSIIDPRRAPVCSNFSDVLDWKGWHCDTVTEKELPLDEITGYNHMAIFLRWCIEKDMMSSLFNEYFEDVSAMVRENPWSYDLRELIRDEFGGVLDTSVFSEEGTAFALYYYNHLAGDGEPCYPSDVDDHALRYFGSERYASDEFCDEAYLFVPYDEEYYADMKAYIEVAYKNFKRE